MNKSLPGREIKEQESRRRTCINANRQMIEGYFQSIASGAYLLENIMQKETR